MVEPPKVLFGKVHCRTVIRFSKKEEQSMGGEYGRLFLARLNKNSENLGWRGFGKW